jgi:hypothetical protein
MTPLSVIKYFDIFEDARPSRFLIGVFTLVNKFLF